MDHPLKQTLELLAEHHDENLNHELAVHGLSRKDLTKSVMAGEISSIPHPVLKEMYIHDAYARIVNIENYCPDKEYWDLKHYLDKLVEKLYTWAQDNPNFLEMAQKLGATDSIVDYDENTILQTVALYAIKSGTNNDDSQAKTEVAGCIDYGDYGYLFGDENAIISFPDDEPPRAA